MLLLILLYSSLATNIASQGCKDDIKNAARRGQGFPTYGYNKTATMRARISQSVEAHLHTRRARRNECCPVPLCSSLTVQRYRKILQICQLHIANLRLKCYFFVMAAFSSSPWGADFLRPRALSVTPPRSGKHSLPTNRLFLEESEGRVLIFFM